MTHAFTKEKIKFFRDIGLETKRDLQASSQQPGLGMMLTQDSFPPVLGRAGWAVPPWLSPSLPSQPSAGARCYEIEVLGNKIQKAFVSKSHGALCSGSF